MDKQFASAEARLNRRIKAHATREGFPSIRALLAAAGVDYSTYWRWMQGTQFPNTRTLDRLFNTRG